jgi:hypothetical protein
MKLFLIKSKQLKQYLPYTQEELKIVAIPRDQTGNKQ